MSDFNDNNLQSVQDQPDTVEEEKGNLIWEELDQSRPMTTRIYETEDDQNLSVSDSLNSN